MISRLFSFLISGIFLTTQSQGAIVLGTANIFAAGQASIPPGAGDGTVPPIIQFPGVANLAFRFSNITGTVSGDSNPANLNGPDGGVYNGNVGTNVNSAGGISGIVHAQRNMFLVGVFYGNTLPTVAPPRLSFSEPEDFLTLAPAIGQSFFIGDGMTDSGNVQQSFLVPLGANKLSVGFIDAADPIPFRGNPGFYSDNAGSLAFDFTISVVPEPASGALVAISTLSCLLRRKRR